MPLQTPIATIMIDACVNGSTFPTWVNLFASLHSTSVAISETSAGSGEVTGGSYTRQDVSWGNAANGAAANDVAVEFATMPQTTVYWTCLNTSSSGGGTIVWSDELTASKSLTAGDTFRFAIGALTATST